MMMSFPNNAANFVEAYTDYCTSKGKNQGHLSILYVIATDSKAASPDDIDAAAASIAARKGGSPEWCAAPPPSLISCRSIIVSHRWHVMDVISH